ncbi:unnamed protein product [Cunninghamella blakesleeana]
MLNSNCSPSSLSTTSTSRFIQSSLTTKNNIPRQQSKLNGHITHQRTTSSSTLTPTTNTSSLLVPSPIPRRTTSSQSIRQQRQSENVKVAVRCRPLSQKEFFGTADNAWNIDTESSKIQLAEQNRRQASQASNEYLFDNVFYGSDNDLLYDQSVKPLIKQAMDGYNATVFAYGQTSSGKTYTMMGTETEPGVIPRAVNEVFEYIKMAMNNEFLLRVSYLEIYNETIRDLLAPENDQLKIHEDRHRGIYVAPLTEEVVTCPKDVMNVIQKGEGNRHISTTDYNLHSSRSHTIFQMVIESRQRSNNSTTLSRSTIFHPSQRSTTLLHNKLRKESVKISQLNLIDLAGSEKAASNQDRRKEGAYINKSLLTLGTVISKLTESGKSAGHIPYRDSKLTRILQSSLSGHAKVVVICTISPYVLAIDESINTLKFATRVKKVVINAKNEPVLDDKALLQQYRGEIVDLKLKLQTANDVLLQEQKNSQSMLTAERQQYEQELYQMRLVRGALKDRIDHLTKLILTSASVGAGPPRIDQLKDITNQHDMTNGDNTNGNIENKDSDNENKTMKEDDPSHNNNNDPWNLVKELRKQVYELKQNNEELKTQMDIQQQKLKQLELESDNQKILVERVAQLEAELSVTKAELEVTSLLAKEVQDTSKGDDHSLWNLTNPSN